MAYSIEPIGIVHSPYKEKFAVPRQPGLVPSARCEVILHDQANSLDAVRGIEQFSHVWLLFLFDQNLEAGWRPTVRPPRLGGNERIGVFASRATFRPNGIGMSAVKLQGVRHCNGQVIIDIAGADLVDGTPIIDIKPYIPYSDSLPEALGGFATSQPATLEVQFAPPALQQLAGKHADYHQAVITEVLAQDPRPAYKKGKPDTKLYAVNLFDFNVQFTVAEPIITVVSIDTVVQ
ncbi:tRNA (N6-threonylcarbamoyladenosine(37)-N6)-methyltransferase TrmO [Photobacterium aquimaris]|uniref:tRNA (N6-threonylcarbamoyladenosine(37)-N6)-methyltransferase TrmO n=1 Tax=Photobacterium aquimaris TaxID=512643 RepID=A0A2T3HXY8_9GAMM|nr:tRNA (N6-threonylcarbamoyladenosine(37)-N6)-methyltransferase TrmO [Photobacterium aquimaris]MCP4954736.1 tRNA (N6-threonylcarbamoyladenosine(37)-N6)-methyltransferase TrmO [Photobacterium aquimaris]OBU24445.1 tRNA-Thr(GGU) m(6)t(6)A37 methyltransferase TsaA [Photobacterium aquimaris]PQJ41811.1 tRNA (N6-threonylcarbamoyladenosine(37)-N6)-methyltransferase TrmO [Photobacterium aquimaris]PSU04379.1 tRNA (N6-threonylcarbamoyladenosine(37)-N6)-methyltransferase TrmO [Photobacterium aquimaris]